MNLPVFCSWREKLFWILDHPEPFVRSAHLLGNTEGHLLFFCGLECVGHSFDYVAHLGFLRDIWPRTQSGVVSSWRTTNIATHPRDPGSGIRCLFDPWIQDTGSGMEQSRIRDPG